MGPRRRRLLLRLLLLLPLAPAAVSGSQGCESKHRTALGECCRVCGPGFGVSVPCGSANTQCEPCRANVTFSSASSATEPCQPCSTCPEQAAEPCTPTSDTVCASPCARGHYLRAGNGTGAQCLPCQVCPEGYGAGMPCGPAHDTVCSRCPDGFYSEEKSSVLPCLPCQPGCNESKVMIRPCSPLSNTLCMDKDLQILKRGEGDPRKELPRKPPLPEDNSKNIIPVYCSILAAVVVGLLAYVGFKCWNTCKQKQQLAKARAGELGGSPEGEKLHSDSGVFLDTHSLQEHHQLSKVPKAEPRLYINLPPHKQEEVEQLLESPSHSKDWRYLASQLGYEDEAIDTFGRGEAPAHTLLSDWSAKEGATLEALCAALAGIERPDVVDNLTGPAEASSVV